MVRKITTSISTVIKKEEKPGKCKVCKAVIMSDKKYCIRHVKAEN